MAIFSVKAWFRSQIKPYLTIIKANGGSGSFSMTTVEVSLGATAMSSGEFEISGLAGLTPGATVLINQAPGPYTGKGTLADEAGDMCVANGYVKNSTTIKVHWSAVDCVLRGNIKFIYKIV
jgi:hypothetical protein